MGKLYEVITVEPYVQAVFNKVLEEATKVFKDKDNLFTGQVSVTDMFDENAPERPTIRQEVDTTVQAKLDHVTKSAVKF